MDVDHMKLDTDLDPIRGEAGYKKLIESLGYNDAMEIYSPDGLTGPTPLLIVLHGSKGSEKAFLEKFKSVADGLKMHWPMLMDHGASLPRRNCWIG